MKKKNLTKVLAVTLGCGMLASCSIMAVAEERDVSLEVETLIQGDELKVFEEILDEFTEETGIGINLVTPGNDYEQVMKTRMASNDLPDVFVTHGWSVLRYKDFLRPLNDQSWFQYYNEDILPNITDEQGNVYICNVSMQYNGYVANKAVLKEAGVDPYEIITLDDMMEACQKIKDAGKIPFYLAGRSVWPAGYMFDIVDPGLYVSEGCLYPGSADKWLDGTFDWTTDGMPALELMTEMINKGFFNEDYLSADLTKATQVMAAGDCAFAPAVSYKDVLTYNQDAELAYLPFPAGTEEGMVRFNGGESNGGSFGVWKDSKYIEEGLQLLEFLARPEIAARICKAGGVFPAMTNTHLDETDPLVAALNETEEMFAGRFYVENSIDRKYFPNGILDYLPDVVYTLFDEPNENGISEAAEYFQEAWEEKYAAAHE